VKVYLEVHYGGPTGAASLRWKELVEDVSADFSSSQWYGDNVWCCTVMGMNMMMIQTMMSSIIIIIIITH